jgi:hypothetical protein
MLITANQSFGEWGKVSSDQAMALAAIDFLVPHATILEMNVESYRRKTAIERKRGRSAKKATIKPWRHNRTCHFGCERQSSCLAAGSHPD